jgi:AraC-like DNA-binding protein
LPWPHLTKCDTGSLEEIGHTDHVGQTATQEAADDWAPGYREWLPSASLRDALACVWVRVIPPGTAGLTADVLPDGCTDLIWQQGRGAFVAGPDTGPAPSSARPGTVLAGVRFKPGAGGPALRVPLAQLRDQRIDLADVLPCLARELPADLAPELALARITRAGGQLASDCPPDPLLVRATAALADGKASVAELAPALGVSERQLGRRFDATVGYGPKTLQRVLRFRRVLAELSARPGSDLASVAYQAGYADQAHLTRETVRLAGRTPTMLVRGVADG